MTIDEFEEPTADENVLVIENDDPKSNYATRYLGKEVGVTIDRPLHSKHPKHGFVTN